ncbi:MAG: Flp family type IVb pilin [Alteraurantiacibacter sp.]
MQAPPIVNQLLTDDHGATAIEYGLIAALIGIAIVGSLDALNGGITGMYGRVETAVSDNLGNH